MKFIRKKIDEGYFKNPEEMRKSSQKRSEANKADLLAKESNRIMKEGIEAILNEALKRDYAKEKGSFSSQASCFLSSEVFGHNATNMLALDVWSMSENYDDEDKFNTRAIVTDLKDDVIELEIEVKLINKKALEHIKKRQEYDERLCECEKDKDFFKKEENLKKIEMINDKFIYDLWTGIRHEDDSYVRPSYLASLKSNINFDFNKYMLSYLGEHKDELRNIPAGSFLIDRRFNIANGGFNFNINKIHVLGGIEGDVVLRTSMATGSNIRALNYAFDLRANTIELFNYMFNMFSFDNTGDLILRDQTSRVPEVVVKKGGAMNEGYFKNPEEKKREIENRKNVSNVERLAKQSDEMLVKPIKNFLEDFVSTTGEYSSYFTKYSTAMYGNVAIYDYLEVFPSFIGDFYICPKVIDRYDRNKKIGFLMKEDMNNIKVENENMRVTKIDYGNKKVEGVIEMGPIVNKWYERHINISCRKLYPLLIDNLYVSLHCNDAYEAAESYITGTWIHDYKKLSKEMGYTIDDKKNDILNYISECKLDLSAEWIVDEDIYLFPVFFDDLTDLAHNVRLHNGWDIDNVELSMSKDGDIFNYYIYPYHEITEKNYKKLAMKKWNKVPLEKMTWEKFCAIRRGDIKESVHYRDWSNSCFAFNKWTREKGEIVLKQYNSFDDVAEAIKKCLADYKIKIVSKNGAHVYLSLGYFDKDYLIG